MELVLGKRKKAKPEVGGMSLIGTSNERPVSWGNYFWLSDGPRIWNFWAENLESAVDEFKLGDEIDIIEYSNGAIIDDARIPKNWYYNKLCFTGGHSPTLEEAREIYEYLGDPNNEFEKFTDPVSYYEKRGSKYNPETGLITTTVSAKSRTLTNVKWVTKDSDGFEIDITPKKLVIGEDDGYFYCPYIPEGFDTSVADPDFDDSKN